MVAPVQDISLALTAGPASRRPSHGCDLAHRTATPLALFFDLTFVVAVAEAATTLHHELVVGHGPEALLAYPVVFFAIWWAWMNLTWFASAYDTDDAAYRLAVLVIVTHPRDDQVVDSTSR